MLLDTSGLPDFCHVGLHGRSPKTWFLCLKRAVGFTSAEVSRTSAGPTCLDRILLFVIHGTWSVYKIHHTVQWFSANQTGPVLLMTLAQCAYGTHSLLYIIAVWIPMQHEVLRTWIDTTYKLADMHSAYAPPRRVSKLPVEVSIGSDFKILVRIWEISFVCKLKSDNGLSLC